MKCSFYITFMLALFCTACGNDTPTQESKEKVVLDVPLPKTPEGVVRLYQKYLDENKFAAAKQISTPREQERLQMLEEIISGDLLDSTLVQTVFLTLDCTEKGDVATCLGTYEEDGEEYEEEFKLTKIKQQWLVDITEEEIFIETEEVMNDSF